MALRRARRCPAESRTISRQVWTNVFPGGWFNGDLVRMANATLQDHAAALLLKDAMVAEMRRLATRLRTVDLSDPEALRRAGRLYRTPIWRLGYSNVPGVGRVRMADLLLSDEDLRFSRMKTCGSGGSGPSPTCASNRSGRLFMTPSAPASAG